MSSLYFRYFDEYLKIIIQMNIVNVYEFTVLYFIFFNRVNIRY